MMCFVSMPQIHDRLNAGPCSAVEDVFLPYMCDERHPADLVVFFFEHDVRFYERDDLPIREWLPLVAGEAVEQERATMEVIPEGSEPRAKGPRTDAGASRPAASQRFGSAQRPRNSRRPESVASQELMDLVTIMNVAGRRGCGDIVWLGWNAGQPSAPADPKKDKASSKLAYGSQAIAWTPAGARRILGLIMHARSQHFDGWLKGVICSDEDLRLRSSYVVPAIGGFSGQHQSLNMQAGASRPASWGRKWTREGTNDVNCRIDDVEPRWLAHLRSKGGAEWLQKLELPCLTDECFWKTQAPPTHPHDKDALWQALLRERSWIDGAGWWVGPFSEAARAHYSEPPWKGAYRGKGWSDEDIVRSLAKSDYWRQLQERPAEPLARLGFPAAPISRLANELATANLQGGAMMTTHGTRQDRDARQYKEAYLQRFFAEPGQQAWRTPKQSAHSFL